MVKTIVSDDYIIYIGKDKYENWQLIDQAFDEDYWFHLNEYPSCHIILHIVNTNIITNKKSLNKILKLCALECKKNSKYNNQKNLSICYTKIKNIQKGENIGSVIYDSGNIKIMEI